MATLTDEEMAALEAKEGKRPALTDEEMARLEAAPLPSREATPEEKEKAGGLSVVERAERYLKSRSAAIADTAKALVTPGGKVAPSFANGLFAGVLPYASAAIDTVPAVVRKVAGNAEDIGATYDRNLARIKPLYEEAETQEPGANLLGALTTPNVAGKGTAARRVLSAGANAGISSATSGGDAGLGAGLGMGAQTLAEGASPAAGALSKYLRGAAGTKAVQSMGTRAGITDRLAKMGVSAEDAPELGNRFLDEGLVPSGLNPFKAPIEGAASRADALKKSAGGRIEDALSKADASGVDFDPLAAQETMRSRMGLANPLEDRNAVKALGLVDDVGGLAPQGKYAAANSFREANRMKSQAWEGADFRTDPKLAPRLYKKAAGGLRDSIAEQVEGATSPGVAASLRQANSQYGLASKATDLLGNAASRDLQKKPFGAFTQGTSALLGVGGLAAGSSTAGIGGAVAPYLAEAVVSRGPAVMAHTARFGSEAAGAAGRYTARPQASAAGGSALARYLNKDDEDDVSWFTRGGK